MKNLILSSLVFLPLAPTSWAQPATTNVHCDVGYLSPENGPVTVTLQKSASLSDEGAFEIVLNRLGEGEIPTIVDLKVEILKSQLFDEYSNTNCGWGCFRSNVKVSTVKVRFTAGENISMQLRGDVGMGVKSVINYGTCYETTSSQVIIHR